MDPAEIEKMLQKLPRDQRRSARIRIAVAVKNGWQHIGLWNGDGAPNIADLVGVSPLGEFDFLPETDDE
jgi:hypothetical protein